MAPLYTTLALFIGSLLILVVLKPTVSPRTREARLARPEAARSCSSGRFGVMAVLSLAQTDGHGAGQSVLPATCR